MKSALQIGMRAGERIYINGAILSVDRKVRIELLNEATFLLGSHVMQLEAATTPLRQIYFIIQSLLMDPAVATALAPAIHSAISDASGSHLGDPIGVGLAKVERLVAKGGWFEALKQLRTLIPLEGQFNMNVPEHPKEVA